MNLDCLKSDRNVDEMHQNLDLNASDQMIRSILADAYHDISNKIAEQCLRWMVKYDKYPCIRQAPHITNGAIWLTAVLNIRSLPENHYLPKELYLDLWCRRETASVEVKEFHTRREAEEALILTWSEYSEEEREGFFRLPGTPIEAMGLINPKRVPLPKGWR